LFIILHSSSVSTQPEQLQVYKLKVYPVGHSYGQHSDEELPLLEDEEPVSHVKLAISLRECLLSNLSLYKGA
jgi:hypothetical protein